jgi:hypothetical protein
MRLFAGPRTNGGTGRRHSYPRLHCFEDKRRKSKAVAVFPSRSWLTAVRDSQSRLSQRPAIATRKKEGKAVDLLPMRSHFFHLSLAVLKACYSCLAKVGHQLSRTASVQPKHSPELVSSRVGIFNSQIGFSNTTPSADCKAADTGHISGMR